MGRSLRCQQPMRCLELCQGSHPTQRQGSGWSVNSWTGDGPSWHGLRNPCGNSAVIRSPQVCQSGAPPHRPPGVARSRIAFSCCCAVDAGRAMELPLYGIQGHCPAVGGQGFRCLQVLAPFQQCLKPASVVTGPAVLVQPWPRFAAHGTGRGAQAPAGPVRIKGEKNGTGRQEKRPAVCAGGAGALACERAQRSSGPKFSCR